MTPIIFWHSQMLELFFKWAIPGLLFLYFAPFKQTLQFLYEIFVRIVHPVYCAGIQTHNLKNMSLIP